MPCPHCADADRLFDERLARKELARLRRRGPRRTTAMLVDAVREGGSSLLDIGGGVGAIQYALVEAGVGRVTAVDASHGYLAVVREEAERRGYADRAEQCYGDFVEVAPEIDPHDVVTLDRVLCCYPDLDALVGASVARKRHAYGVVFPKDRWWMRAGIAMVNATMWVRGSAFRAYVHEERRVDALVAEAGLVPAVRRSTWLWNVWVWRREEDGGGSPPPK